MKLFEVFFEDSKIFKMYDTFFKFLKHVSCFLKNSEKLEDFFENLTMFEKCLTPLS